MDELFPEMDRRKFLQLTGAGLFVFFTFPGLAALGAEKSGISAQPLTDFNAYLLIQEDGRVKCFTGKIEMGQGIFTSLQQMLAEELDIGLDSVEIVMGDTHLCPYDRGTFGSLSTRFFGPPLRKAGAEARQVLLEMAAEKWNRPVEKLMVENGIIYDSENRSQKVSYGDLAKGIKMAVRPKGVVHLKKPGQFKIIGKGYARKDGFDKVTGKAKYAADIILPGMLYAKILRPPTHGSKLVSVDVSEAKKIKGVSIVQEKDFVAVLHERPDIASAALAKVKAKFSDSTLTTDENTIFDHLRKNKLQPKILAERGDLKKGETSSHIKVEEIFYNDYVAHAAIETHSAVVKIENNEATVWASTQTPFLAQEQVAKELGFPKEKVRVLPVFIGGGFGGKSNYPQIVAAARCARLSGKPVQVAWSREEEFFFDTFRPASIIKIRSGLGADQKISFWDYQVYYAGDRGADLFYTSPNARTLSYGSVMESGPNQVNSHPFAVGPWRGPGNNSNSHARESHMDLLAEKAKIDPVQFRLNHLEDKQKKVLNMAAEKFGWKPHIGPSGKGVGVACAMDAGTFVTLMAEVGIDPDSGIVNVKRVVCVQDMGLVINPRGARAQMEGSIIMGLGYALRESIHFKNGQIFDTNFGTYELPRFSWLPKIETFTIDNQDSEAQGGGEPTIVAVGAAIANAVNDALKVRMLRLPLSPERVLDALKEANK